MSLQEGKNSQKKPSLSEKKPKTGSTKLPQKSSWTQPTEISHQSSVVINEDPQLFIPDQVSWNMLLVSTTDDDIIANQNEGRFQISVPITSYTTPQKSPPTINEVPEPMEIFFSKTLLEEFKVAGTKPDTSNIDSESDTSNTSWTPVYNIEVFLQDYKLNIIEQEGDGNCLFRCIAAHIFGDSTRHNTIRRSIVDHIRQNRSNYEVFFLMGLTEI